MNKSPESVKIGLVNIGNIMINGMQHYQNKNKRKKMKGDIMKGRVHQKIE